MNIQKNIKNFCQGKPILENVLDLAIFAKQKISNRQRINIRDLNISVPIEDFSTNFKNDVVEYWTDHTVNSIPFYSSEKSLNYLQWRFDQYPHFRELMNMWGQHEGQVVLDYGCGPGNDTVGFLNYSKAKSIIGIDVSHSALSLTSHRLALHKEADLNRVRLIKVATIPKLPLEDNSVDYIYSGGVIHHTTYPLGILKELHRVLKVGGSAHIMVYNRDSIWMHLYVAYEKKILQKKYQSFNDEEAFARTTDGENCPLARCYKPEEFLALAYYAGFSGTFCGGYFAQSELDVFKNYQFEALANKHFPIEHKKFIQELTLDQNGFPLHEGLFAGVGGVFKFTKTQ